MKKILTIMAAVAAVFAFSPSKAEAGGGYQSRVLSRCGHCSHNVYAYYRPVSYCNARPVYGWVPSYHSNCGHSRSGGYVNRGYSGSSFSYGSRSRGSSFSFSYGTRTPSYSNRGYSSGYGSRGYRSSGYRSCR